MGLSPRGRPQLARMPLAGEIDKALDPVQVSLFGPPAILLGANAGADLIEQPGLFGLRFGNRLRFRILTHFLLPITDSDAAMSS